ncbi:MAG: ribonuclease III [Myxococcota bacterium]|nr:ribonuclease III [Myxococcota bacterium]
MKDPAALYLQALTHSSWAHENSLPDGSRPADYERLEFLGDAVLELCVRELLLGRFPNADEGQLTPAKQQLVKNEALPAIAARLGILQAARLGRSMRTESADRKRAVEADMTEALLGALFLHLGLDAAREVVRTWFGEVEITAARAARHPKVELQERLDQRGIHNQEVRYDRLTATGPAHARRFRVAVAIQGRARGEGVGTSWKKAEKAAAAAALRSLGEE